MFSHASYELSPVYLWVQLVCIRAKHPTSVHLYSTAFEQYKVLLLSAYCYGMLPMSVVHDMLLQLLFACADFMRLPLVYPPPRCVWVQDYCSFGARNEETKCEVVHWQCLHRWGSGYRSVAGEHELTQGHMVVA